MSLRPSSTRGKPCTITSLRARGSDRGSAPACATHCLDWSPLRTLQLPSHSHSTRRRWRTRKASPIRKACPFLWWVEDGGAGWGGRPRGWKAETEGGSVCLGVETRPLTRGCPWGQDPGVRTSAGPWENQDKMKEEDEFGIPLRGHCDVAATDTSSKVTLPDHWTAAIFLSHVSGVIRSSRMVMGK